LSYSNGVAISACGTDIFMGSMPVLWIWIHMNLHNFGNPDPHQIYQDPEPHPSDKLDLDPHQFADDKRKCMEYELI
jgi:hypothetical protein